MKSTVELNVEKPAQLKQILQPSLESDDQVSYKLTASEDSLTIQAETDSLGPLRGCTDTVFRLASLAVKLY